MPAGARSSGGLAVMDDGLHPGSEHEARRLFRDIRLCKHADYQRVYRQSRKQFSPSMSYFFALRSPGHTSSGPRVGLTAGRVLGNAVERNRIKRRMREAVRVNLSVLKADVDVVLHPRRSLLTLDFARLSREVRAIFVSIQSAASKQDAAL